jgi:hypothetical protein
MDDQGTNREGGNSIGPLRFSLKRLLLSTGLIAVGVAYASYWTVHGDRPHPLGDACAFVMWIGSGASIGAGVFLPFRKPWIGAFLGALASLVVLGFSIRIDV